MNLKPSDVSTLVVEYIGFPSKEETAKRFNDPSTCPLCIEIGDDDHDPQYCYGSVEYMADGAASAW